MSYTQFIVLRHGLPKRSDCLLGRTDPELTPKGILQMSLGAAELEFDLIISSPLSRCHSFATQLANERNCPLIIDNAWQELDFGAWDGKPIAELWQQTVSSSISSCISPYISHSVNEASHDTDSGNQGSIPCYSQFWHAPFAHTPPGGESSESLLARISASVERLSKAHSGQRILIISHSGVMRMLLAWLLNSYQTGNAHLSRVQLNHAATLQFNTYLDEADCLWPQLQGFNNPCLDNHSLLDK